MRLVVFDDHRIGTLEPDGIHDVTDLLEPVPVWAAPYRMNALIAAWDELCPVVETRRTIGPIVDPSTVRFRAPTPRPRNFLAAPLNYVDHGTEMRGSLGSGGGTPHELGFFVKASGCLAGPYDAVELPRIDDRRFDHEGELGVVIGHEARGVDASAALGHVFGYTLVLDATMRMTETRREERTMRKSFATFSPAGPCIVTADEIADPARLTVRLWVGDEQRQEGHLEDLIVDIPGLIAMASGVLPLQAGDLIATGSPSGVGPIRPGDVIRVAADEIGEMRLPVTERAW